MNDDLESLYDDAMEALQSDDVDAAVELLNRMLDLSPDAPHTLEIQGDVALWMEEPQQAEEHYQRLLNETDDDYWKGVAHASLGAAFESSDQTNRVREHFVLAVDFFLSDGAIVKAIEAYVSIASFDDEQGDLESAAEALLKALALIGSQDDVEELDEMSGVILQMLGTCYRQQGNLDAAKETLNRALRLFQKLEEPDECANTLDAIGVIAQIQGQYDAAEELHLKAVTINETLGHDEGLSTNFGNLAILNIHRKQYDAAAQWAAKGHEIDVANDNENGVAHYHLLMGEIEIEREDLVAAEEYLETATKLYEECGDAEDCMCVQGKTAVLYRLQGRLDEASAIGEQVMKEAERMGHGDGIAATLEDLAHTRKAQGRIEEARSYWQRALAMYEELESEVMIADVKKELAGLE